MKEKEKGVNNKFILKISSYLGSHREAEIFVHNLLSKNSSLTKAQIFEIATKGKGKPKSTKRKDGKKLC